MRWGMGMPHVVKHLETAMELDPVFLSPVQFAFVISFYIIFLAFAIGLAAWLATKEEAYVLGTNPRPLYDVAGLKGSVRFAMASVEVEK